MLAENSRLNGFRELQLMRYSYCLFFFIIFVISFTFARVYFHAVYDESAQILFVENGIVAQK